MTPASGTAVTPTTAGTWQDPAVHARRWAILAVLCISLFVIVLDNTILNVALPTLVRDLDASNSELQWIVDSYTLVFAGLLLTAGSLGDKYGRRGALQFGLLVFGIGSVMSALSGSPGTLIATRALMGIGGAFIMPATLSILTNVFPPEERGRAIGIWAGVAGLAVLGPLVGGFLLDHFYWGSVFYINAPVVIFGLITGFFLIPNSKDPAAPRLDPVGAILSVIGLASLLFAIIEAPDKGWTSTEIIGSFTIALVALVGFAIWEMRSDHPMLDIGFFENPRFSAASAGIMFVFFAMFGGTFLLTQYFQLVLGYSPLQTGIRMVPWAVVMVIVAPSSSRFVQRFGTKYVVAVGLLSVAVALGALSTLNTDSSYLGDVLWRLCLMAFGMGLTMAPATESIMGSLPLGKAGVGSAMNDTTRQVGGAFGVAIIGSVLSSIYSHQVLDSPEVTALPASVQSLAESSLGGALNVAAGIGGAQGRALAQAAQEAFVSGMHSGLRVGAAAALIGAIVAVVWLPARAANATPAGVSPPPRLDGAGRAADGVAIDPVDA